MREREEREKIVERDERGWEKGTMKMDERRNRERENNCGDDERDVRRKR